MPLKQKEEGCALIRANAEKAGVKNLTVVPGKKQPESLYGYPAPGPGISRRKQR